MALNTFVTTLIAAADGGTRVTTGVGFQPKDAILFGSDGTATSLTANASASIGACDIGLTQGAVTLHTYDAQTPANANVLEGPGFCAQLCGGDETDKLTALVSSFDADGSHTLWTNTGASASTLHPILYLGGTDITASGLGTLAMPATAGNFSFSGLGFKPDFLFLWLVSTTTTGGVTRKNFSVGWANKYNQGWSGVSNADATTPQDYSYQSSSSCMGVVGQGNPVEAQCSLVSFNSSGFTLNRVNGTYGGTPTIYFLAVKGLKTQIGSFTASGTGSVQNPVTGFTPKGLMLMSAGNPAMADQSAQEDMQHSFAAVDSALHMRCRWIGAVYDSGAALSRCQSSYATAQTLLHYVWNGSAWVASFNAVVTSLDANGFTWTINTNTNSPEILYCALGDNISTWIKGGNILGGKLATA